MLCRSAAPEECMKTVLVLAISLVSTVLLADPSRKFAVSNCRVTKITAHAANSPYQSLITADIKDCLGDERVKNRTIGGVASTVHQTEARTSFIFSLLQAAMTTGKTLTIEFDGRNIEGYYNISEVTGIFD